MKTNIVNFKSDNAAGASKQIIQALIDCNDGSQSPYGADACSKRVEAQFKEIFEADVSIYLVATGTAANTISLSVMCPPWGAILCHQDSHIINDENSAPEFMSGGARLLSVQGENSKISPDSLKTVASSKKGDVHSVQATAVSITQVTETGSTYTLDEIKAISAVCKEQDMTLHMDGARFANAIAELECTPADMTWKAGVDILSFGATKNGAMGVEAIVVFNKALIQSLEFRRKRAGHLLSKMRYLSAQMESYLDNDLWLKNARHSNNMAKLMAKELKSIVGVNLIGECESNIIFCKLPETVIKGLHKEGFEFYHNRWGKGIARLVTSFQTTEDEVKHFISVIRSLL